MHGNYYGVDIKINPEGKPYLIEINGWNSGTKGFIEAYGDLRTQEKILASMADYTGGKPIYSRSGGISAKTGLSIGLMAALAPFYLWVSWPLVTLLEKAGIRSVPFFHARHAMYRNALTDLHWVLIEKCAVDTHMDQAAKQIGIDFVRFRKAYYHSSGDVVIKVGPTEWKVLSSDGGLYSGVGSPYSSKYNDYIANPYTVEKILNSKWYVHKLLQNTWLQDYLPRTLLDGTAKDFPSELERLQSSPLVIQKPHHGRRGKGVHIFRGKDLPSSWYSRRLAKDMDLLSRLVDINPKIELNQLRWNINFNHFWNTQCVLQEYIPSRPVRSRKTGALHDSCIRAIVFNGEFIDAYHRLAPGPIKEVVNEKNGVANLARGAFAEPLTDQEKDIVSTFAEHTVQTLENRIEALYLDDWRDWLSYEYKFWKDELAQIKDKSHSKEEAIFQLLNLSSLLHQALSRRRFSFPEQLLSSRHQ